MGHHDVLEEVRRAAADATTAELGDAVADFVTFAKKRAEVSSHDERQELLALARRLAKALANALDTQDIAAAESLGVQAWALPSESSAEVPVITYSGWSIGQIFLPMLPWQGLAKVERLIDAICVPMALASGLIFFLPGPLRYELCYLCMGLCLFTLPYAASIVCQLNWKMVRRVAFFFEPWFLLANMAIWIVLSLVEEYHHHSEIRDFFHALSAYSHVAMFALPLAFVDAAEKGPAVKAPFCLTWCVVTVSVLAVRVFTPRMWHGWTIATVFLEGRSYDLGTGPLIRAAALNTAIFAGKFAFRGIVSRNAVVLRRPVRVTLRQLPLSSVMPEPEVVVQETT